VDAVEAIERAEKSIDEFIIKRSRKRDERQERLEAEWAASDRRLRRERRRQLREEWAQFHMTMNRLHQGLADEHAARRSRLMLEISDSADGAA
jgi:hypothetical protein